MEISDVFKITLKLGGQNFSVNIKRDDEQYYRDAEKHINQRYSFYANSYPGQTQTTYLLMTILEIAVDLQRAQTNGSLKPVLATINGIVNDISAALKG